MAFYKTTPVPMLMNGCKSWVPTKKIISQIQNSEISFMRRTNYCTEQDGFCNKEIRN